MYDSPLTGKAPPVYKSAMNANHYDPEKLKKLRAEKSLRDGSEITQQIVADALGVQRQTIYRAENGLDISYERICDLADYYGVEVTSLLHSKPKAQALAA